jgi:hypothetical protein
MGGDLVWSIKGYRTVLTWRFPYNMMLFQRFEPPCTLPQEHMFRLARLRDHLSLFGRARSPSFAVVPPADHSGACETRLTGLVVPNLPVVVLTLAPVC